jgi:predicted Zn-ribbon and HTH transcriptional regulator
MGTKRQELTDLLTREELSSKDISRLLSVREKEVFDHLEHIARSLGGGRSRLRITPYQCLACEFTFKDRKKLTRPGKCPNCRKTRIRPATFKISQK